MKHNRKHNHARVEAWGAAFVLLILVCGGACAEEAAGASAMSVLSSALYAVLAILLPYAGTQLVKYLKAKQSEAAQSINNETIRTALAQATDAVFTAVLHTNQTYVDELKGKNLFDAAAQQVAFAKCKEVAEGLLTQGAKTVLETLYGSADKWIDAKIEEEVRVCKQST